MTYMKIAILAIFHTVFDKFFFGRIFLAAHTIQTVLKHIWIRHCMNQYIIIHLLYFIFCMFQGVIIQH